MKRNPTYEELEQRVRELENESSRREQAERALQEQLHFLQTLIDTIPSPIFFKDASDMYQGCNKTFEARLGLRREDILGKSAVDIFPKDLAAKYDEVDSALLKKPGAHVAESTLQYADGTRHDAIINKATFVGMDGTLAGIVGVTVDITELKDAERALRKALDEMEVRVKMRTAELEKANQDLLLEIAERKRMEEALLTSSEKLKLFAYSISHDLKSPAVALHGLTQLLQRQFRDALDERGRKICDQIKKTAEQIAAFVEKINIYIATREMPLKIESIDVGEILAQIREEFFSRIEARRIRWCEPAGIPTIDADRLSVLRVFRNFVDNALKYGGNGVSEIRIDYSQTEAFHVFSVTDDGVGIQGEDCQKIFDLFRRHDTSKNIEGSGLGLAIVKEIAMHHRGEVWVEPGPEGGTTFCISVARDLCECPTEVAAERCHAVRDGGVSSPEVLPPGEGRLHLETERRKGGSHARTG